MKKIVILVLSMTLLTGCGLKEEVENNEKKINDISSTTEILYAYPDSKNIAISQNEYDNITTGLSYEEVVSIIGGKCTKTLENTVENMTQTIYGCNGEIKGSSVLLTFINNKLTTKIEKGFEE